MLPPRFLVCVVRPPPLVKLSEINPHVCTGACGWFSSGQNIQDVSEDGESLLSLACSAGYYELAEVLLRMRASVEDRGVKGQSDTLWYHIHENTRV